MKQSIFIFLVLASMLILFSGCGKKTKPQPIENIEYRLPIPKEVKQWYQVDQLGFTWMDPKFNSGETVSEYVLKGFIQGTGCGACNEPLVSIKVHPLTGKMDGPGDYHKKKHQNLVLYKVNPEERLQWYISYSTKKGEIFSDYKIPDVPRPLKIPVPQTNCSLSEDKASGKWMVKWKKIREADSLRITESGRFSKMERFMGLVLFIDDSPWPISRPKYSGVTWLEEIKNIRVRYQDQFGNYSETVPICK